MFNQTIKKILKKVATHSIVLKRLYVWYRKSSQAYQYPNWEQIIKSDKKLWLTALKNVSSGPKILLATSTGSLPTAVILDSLLATALTLRGADIHIILCDSSLPACLMCEVGLMRPKNFIRSGPQKYFCKNCFNPAQETFKHLGNKIHKFSELITQENIKQAKKLSYTIPLDKIKEFTTKEGFAIGEHAQAGALRFFARGALNKNLASELVLRQYFNASILTASAVKNIIKSYDFKCLSCINGIYVPTGIISEVARQNQINVVNWSVAYKKCSFIFSHNDTYHHTLMNEPTLKWENIQLTKKSEKKITNYLESRRRGGRDWIVFNEQSKESIKYIKKELKMLDLSKPCIGLLTNVVWDAQLHYPANVFSNMIEWILKTIHYFKKRQDLQLIIRAHPAELSGDIPTRQPIIKEIKKEFPVLPKNIFIVKPQSKISTYTLMEQCNAVLIYGTKTGVELTSRGIPVIVAGEAWIRNKKITIDAQTQKHYFEILNTLPFKKSMDENQIKRARKYAFHFFFRRMIPISLVSPTGSEPQFRLNVNRLTDLLPGQDVGLDIICNGILTGTDFIYPAEKFYG